MSVTINLPDEIESRLRTRTPDLGESLKEAAALELFRPGVLSHFELSQVLGCDRFETDAYLRRHNVFEGSLTSEDIDSPIGRHRRRSTDAGARTNHAGTGSTSARRTRNAFP